jgi:hypothetical protein
MSSIDRKTFSHNEQQRIYLLARHTLYLDDQAEQLRYELNQLNKALRITQERIREVNVKIEWVRQGDLKLAIVLSNGRAFKMPREACSVKR